MKVQDILLLTVTVVLAVQRSPRLLVITGLGLLVFAAPLYAMWVFFTAQRLVMFAFLMFAIAAIRMTVTGQNPR